MKPTLSQELLAGSSAMMRCLSCKLHSNIEFRTARIAHATPCHENQPAATRLTTGGGCDRRFFNVCSHYSLAREESQGHERVHKNTRTEFFFVGGEVRRHCARERKWRFCNRCNGKRFMFGRLSCAAFRAVSLSRSFSLVTLLLYSQTEVAHPGAQPDLKVCGTNVVTRPVRSLARMSPFELQYTRRADAFLRGEFCILLLYLVDCSIMQTRSKVERNNSAAKKL